MNTTHSTQLSTAKRSPLAHIFTIEVTPSMSRADKRRYFRNMQADMAHAGLLMNYSDGFCVAVKARDPDWRTDRHLFANWVIGNRQSRHLTIMDPIPLGRMLEGDFNLEADLIRLSLAEEKVSRWLISKVLTGLVTRAIDRLQRDEEV
jgi:hypothetical protein